MMKALYPYPVTTPPKEIGYYWTNKGEYHFKDGKWRRCGTEDEVFPDYYYSDQPPPEIENAIEEIKHTIDIRPKDGSEYNHIELTIESAQTLLQTLKAE